jgi:hypothetical protein
MAGDRFPSTYCDAQIARGELVRLLPDWSSPEIFVHAVYPTRRFLPAKLQGIARGLEGLEEPPLDSAAMIRRKFDLLPAHHTMPFTAGLPFGRHERNRSSALSWLMAPLLRIEG